MEVIKQKLVALRSELDQLNDKVVDVDDLVRSSRKENDELQNQLMELCSKEKLMQMKLKSTNSRLTEIENKLSRQTNKLETSEKSMEDKPESDTESKEENLERILAEKLAEIRSVDAQYDEHDIIESLEEQLRSLHVKLDAASDTYESTERETSRVNRLIEICQGDLKKQQAVNEALRKELDSVVGDFESI